MTNIYFDTDRQAVWLSYEYLREKNIPEDSFMNWSKRGICARMYLNGRAYIKYDTIPEPTRAKLPTIDGIRAEYNRKKIENTVYLFTKELEAAYKCMRLPVYVREIPSNTAYSKLKDGQVTEFARKACVIERVLWLHKEYHRPNKLEALFYAYSSIYPNDYSMKSRFCMMLKKAREEGILSVAIDKRIFRELAPRYTAVHIQLAEAFLRDSRNFSMRACHEKVTEACNELQMKEHILKQRKLAPEERIPYKESKSINLDNNEEVEAITFLGGFTVFGLPSGTFWQDDKNYVRIVP